MCRQVEIDGADEVVRADQVVLLVPGQIAKVQHAEAAEGEEHADRARVLGRIRRAVKSLQSGFGAPAPTSGLVITSPAAETKRTSIPAIGSVSPGRARICRPFARVCEVVVVQLRRALALLHRRAVIDEGANRHARRQRRDAADVIGVVVRHDEVVDPRQPGLLHRRRDAIGVAAVEAGVARVDQQRLARRRDNQRRLAAFDVDEVDVERLSRWAGTGVDPAAGPREGKQQQQGSHGAPV